MPPKKDLAVGLDIGSHSIKIVSLEKKRNKWTLKDFDVIPFSAGEEEDFSRYESWVLATLKEAVGRMGIGGCSVFSTLGGSQVALRKLTFPDMPSAEIKEAARWQGKAAFPFPLEEAMIDIHLLGKVKKEGESQQEVLVAAAQKGVVQQRSAVLEACGLDPVSLTLAPLCLKNAFLFSPSRIGGESAALIDIGNQTTTIAMVQHDDLVFSREVPLGGQDFTRAIIDLSRDLNPAAHLKTGEAEKIKMDYGVVGSDLLFSQDETTDNGLSLKSLQSYMHPVLERLVIEVDRSFGYFKTQVGEASIDRIFLSGGGALLKGLPETFKRNFNLPVVRYEFWEDLEIGPDLESGRLEAAKPLLSIAVGLVLEDKSPLNLLPYVKKSGFPFIGETARKAAAYGAIPAIFFGFIAYQAVSYYGELSKLNKRLALRQQEVSRLESSRNHLEALKARDAELEGKLEEYPPAMITRVPAQGILSEIARKVPANTTLTSLSLIPEAVPAAAKNQENKPEGGPAKPAAPASTGLKGQGQLLLKGTVFGPGDVIIQSLDEFGRSLEKGDFFTEVRLDEISKNENLGSIPAVNFQMNLRLRY
jgi:type IV pilus assembly protein PilM